MTFLKTAVAATALVIMGAGAQAATFDFATDAEAFESSNGFEGTFAQVYGVGGATDGGITVNAYSMAAYEEVETHPFMDSYNGTKPAGLGVCSSGFTGEISNCNGTGDDNLLYPEILELVFSESVYLTDMFVRDAVHNPLTLLAGIWINFDFYDVLNGVVDLTGLAMSESYYISSGSTCLPHGDEQIKYVECEPGAAIYVSSISAAVPIPAAGFLLLGGLGGLAALRRRKKA